MSASPAEAIYFFISIEVIPGALLSLYTPSHFGCMHCRWRILNSTAVSASPAEASYFLICIEVIPGTLLSSYTPSHYTPPCLIHLTHPTTPHSHYSTHPTPPHPTPFTPPHLHPIPPHTHHSCRRFPGLLFMSFSPSHMWPQQSSALAGRSGLLCDA